VTKVVTCKNLFNGRRRGSAPAGSTRLRGDRDQVLVIINAQTDPIGALGPPLLAAGLALTFCDVGSSDLPAGPEHYAAVVAMGGDTNPDDDHIHGWLRAERALLRTCVERGVPTIAVCLGAELLAQALGGRARRMARPRIGWMRQHTTPNVATDPLDVAWAMLDRALEWHAYDFDLPPHATLLAGRTDAVQAFRAGRSAWGFQYHLEADAQLAAHWLNVYSDDLDEFVDASTVVDDGRRSGADRAGHGRAVGHAFAELAVERAMKTT
jgi:GMP synthase (glutamine-hydrolysing)